MTGLDTGPTLLRTLSGISLNETRSAPANLLLKLKAAYITLLTTAFLDVNDNVTSRSVRESARFFPQGRALSLTGYPSCLMDEVLRGINLYITHTDQPEIEKILFDQTLPALLVYLNQHATSVSEESISELRPILESMLKVIQILEGVQIKYQEHIEKIEIAKAVHTALTCFFQDSLTASINPLFSASQQEPKSKLGHENQMKEFLTRKEKEVGWFGPAADGQWRDNEDLKKRERYSRLWHDYVNQFSLHLSLVREVPKLNGESGSFLGPCVQDIASMLTNNTITTPGRDPLVTRQIIYSMFEVLLCKNMPFSADTQLIVTLITIAKAFLYLYEPYQTDKESSAANWDRLTENGPTSSDGGRQYIKQWAQWILVELDVLDVLICLAESTIPVVKQANLSLGYALLEGESRVVQVCSSQ